MSARRILTLINSEQAKIGNKFIHKGADRDCRNCKYSKVCVDNLENGRVYTIIKVRDKTLECNPHKSKMKVVEVVGSKIPSSLPSNRSIAGAIVTFEFPHCEIEVCENSNLCFPIGLNDGDKCEVLEVTGSINCLLGNQRKKVSLQLVLV